MSQHTVIRVDGVDWSVPRGFGLEYRRHAALDLSGEPWVIVDLLALVGYAVTEQQVAGWSRRRRVEASVWAANVHARASDVPAQRHPDLPWLPRPWAGPWSNDGIMSGPSPTVVP